jgi:hypothetical protein
VTAPEVRKLIAWVQRLGCQVARARNGHYRVTFGGRYVGTIACTPSDRRTPLNDKARIRRSIRAIKAAGR